MWKLRRNGIEISQGEFKLPDIDPGKEALVNLPVNVPQANTGDEYFLRISFMLAEDRLWARKGFEMASEQFLLPARIASVPVTEPGQVTMTQNDNEIVVNGSGFRIVFDKLSGTFSSFEKKGVNMLKKDGGPRLHLWRAPHRNDDMWADRSWVTAGLRELKWTTGSVTAVQTSASAVTISVKLSAEGKNNFTVNHDVVYTVAGDGSITAVNTISSGNPSQVVANIGVRMFLDKQFDQAAYFGRGPMENYADRKRGFDVGLYKSSVTEQLTTYEKPMECGNHEDVRWASVTNKSGLGIMALCDTTLLQVSMLPYSDEEMDKVEYRIDLPQSNSTVFKINYRTLGVGTAGCGPRPLPQYIVYAAPSTFVYKLRLLE
jgi:beta-galactosidase